MALGGSRTLGSPPSLPSPPSSSKHPRTSNAVDKMYRGSGETLVSWPFCVLCFPRHSTVLLLFICRY
jgi:hypothetical protein